MDVDKFRLRICNEKRTGKRDDLLSLLVKYFIITCRKMKSNFAREEFIVSDKTIAISIAPNETY